MYRQSRLGAYFQEKNEDETRDMLSAMFQSSFENQKVIGTNGGKHSSRKFPLKDSINGVVRSFFGP